MAFVVFSVSAAAPSAWAQWRDEIGYTQLFDEVGGELETGAGVSVAIAEAYVGGNYLPNFSDAEYDGKTIVDQTGLPSGVSSHAQGVFKRFIGNTTSIAGGVTDITLYEANHWVDRVLKWDGGVPAGDPELPSYQIQNNSWIGNFSDNALAIDMLNRVDYVVDQADVLMVGGTANRDSGVPDVLGHGYNALIVGRTSGNHGSGLTSFNGAGRVKPHLVAPASTSSIATPTVSSAAAVLYEAAAGTQATRVETMRAILMAGATKSEFTDWDRTTSRPLDEVYGAGELNIYNSYQIVQGGGYAATSAEPTFAVGLSGWSYVESFTPEEPLYYDFAVAEGSQLDELSVILSWNLSVYEINGDPYDFDPKIGLSNLDMRLYDSSETFLGSLVDASLSPVDNVEHLYLQDLASGRYTLEIVGDRSVDFGLAWHGILGAAGGLSAVPEPATVWFLVAAGGWITARRIRSARRCRDAGCGGPDSVRPRS